MIHHPISVTIASLRLATLVVVLTLFTGLALAETTVTNIVMSPSPPAALEYDTQVDVTFDYETDEPGGVWIGFLPYTDGSRNPNLTHSGGPSYPEGSGSGSFSFTVTAGPAIIDQIQVEMFDTTLAYLEDSFPLPYTYAFVESGSITNIVMTPTTPATLNLGKQGIPYVSCRVYPAGRTVTTLTSNRRSYDRSWRL